MDVSNSVIITPLSQDVPKRVENLKQTKDDGGQSGYNATPKQLAAPADLEQRSNEIHVSKVQRLNSLDSAPLNTQRAVNTYQQTIDAAREYEYGELVGVDLFV